MTEIKWRDFRENLADIINRVRFENERIAITRHGKVVAELRPFTERQSPQQAEGANTSTPPEHSHERAELAV